MEAPNSAISGAQVLAVEVPDALPAVVGRLDPVGGAVDREERVTGALVGVELIRLARGLEGLLQLADLLRRRVLVIGAEQAEQGAGQGRGLVHDRADLEGDALGRGAD